MINMVENWLDDKHGGESTTVVLEIYAGIKLCVLANF